MAHKFDPAHKEALTSARRQEAVQPHALLQEAGLEGGHVVLDLGCGTGFFAIPAASLVGPTGQVIGVDIQPEMIQAIQEAARRAGCTNVTAILAPGDYTLPVGLPPADWVILAYVLHEVTEPQRLLGLALQSLKPGGKILIVEWPKEDGPHGPPKAERLAPAELAAHYGPLGLQRLKFWEGPPEFYALVLQASP